MQYRIYFYNIRWHPYNKLDETYKTYTWNAYIKLDTYMSK
jgi:hypothetical protein